MFLGTFLQSLDEFYVLVKTSVNYFSHTLGCRSRIICDYIICHFYCFSGDIGVCAPLYVIFLWGQFYPFQFSLFLSWVFTCTYLAHIRFLPILSYSHLSSTKVILLPVMSTATLPSRIPFLPAHVCFLKALQYSMMGLRSLFPCW